MTARPRSCERAILGIALFAGLTTVFSGCSVSHELGFLPPDNGEGAGGTPSNSDGGGGGMSPEPPGQVGHRLVGGAVHACVLSTVGLSCWGGNGYGQLGDGTMSDRELPGPLTLGNVTLASRAFWATQCAAQEQGVVCWGRNNQGQIDGSGVDRLKPVKLPSLSAASNLAMGTWHGCAREVSGRVACWGQNDRGQVGDGTTEPRPGLPTTVIGLPSDVVQLSLGASHSCARTLEREVYCWGENMDGQIEEEPSDAVPVPTLVSSLPPVIDLAAGGFHNCVVTADGAVLCFGRNEFGESGSGTTLVRQIDLPGRAQAVTAHARHSCALLEDGAVMCFGRSADGEIGQRDAGPEPMRVPGVPPASEVLATEGGGCARTTEDELWCWGLAPGRTDPGAAPAPISAPL